MEINITPVFGSRLTVALTWKPVVHIVIIVEPDPDLLKIIDALHAFTQEPYFAGAERI